jgi:hypothetical protein
MPIEYGILPSGIRFHSKKPSDVANTGDLPATLNEIKSRQDLEPQI